jgi:hypothetical protein
MPKGTRLNKVIFIVSQVAIPAIQRQGKGGEDDDYEEDG